MSVMVFLKIPSLDSSVLYRSSASCVSAVFSLQAFVPIDNALVNTSLAPDALSNASRIRISDSPISSKVLIADPPFLFMLSSPLIKLMIALAASSSNAFLNSSALIPATEANCSNCSPPFCVARFIFEIKLEKAVPPASASIPTEDSAPENDMIWASVKPTWCPAPAILIAMSTISDSVVARLFPSATMVDPSLSKLS